MPRQRYFFASYVRADANQVYPFIEALRRDDIDVWYDMDIAPGVSFEEVIYEAISNAIGLLIFVSKKSLQSEWVIRELEASLRRADLLIIPVFLERDSISSDPRLKEIQGIELYDRDSMSVIQKARESAPKLRDALRSFSDAEPFGSNINLAAEVKEIVADIKIRPTQVTDNENTPPRSVFVIHGHDDLFLNEVENYLSDIDVQPVVLKRIGGQDLSLWQKFLRFSKETRYAIVLLSADDLGASLKEYEWHNEGKKVGINALQYRSRQNVILELGFFYGYLDFDRVFVLFKPPENPFPRFETPSDLGGIVYDIVDNRGLWKIELKNRLQKGGFVIK